MDCVVVGLGRGWWPETAHTDAGTAHGRHGLLDLGQAAVAQSYPTSVSVRRSISGRQLELLGRHLLWLGIGELWWRRRQFRRSIAIRRIKSVLGLQAIIVARVAVAVARVAAAAAVAPVAAETIVVDTIPITALIGHNRGAFQRFNALLISGHGHQGSTHANGSHGGHDP